MGPTQPERASRPRQPAAIPHTLSDFPCIDFVNSRFRDHTGTGEVFDRLQSPEWRAWYAQRCGITPARAASPATVRELVQLRDVLRPLIESGRAPAGPTLARLNRVLGAAEQVWELGRSQRAMRMDLSWQRADWSAVMAATVASYARLLVGGGIRRVKVCGNPECTFMFFDESRNRSRRWCESAACGNLVNVRAHRARRQRAAAAPARSRRTPAVSAPRRT